MAEYYSCVCMYVYVCVCVCACAHHIFFHMLEMLNNAAIDIGKDIIWPTKACIVKAMVFSVVMYNVSVGS